MTPASLSAPLGAPLSAPLSADSAAVADRLAAAPVIRVVHGNPTPEETAVVVAVVAAAATTADAASTDEVGVRMRPDGPLIVSYWNSPARQMRRRFTLRNRPGPRAWVFSGRS